MTDNKNIREKIGDWLSEDDNKESDLIDFLINECGVVLSVGKCIHCDKKILKDSEDSDNAHINANYNIICDDCLDKCDCEDCLHICGETGGRRGGGCGKRRRRRRRRL